MTHPQVTRTYAHHHLDSDRWSNFETRPDDIVITTAYKSGTTWMQTIVANLLFQDGNIPGPVMEISPWVDMRPVPFESIRETTAAQTHRRFLKTHLALDGLPYKEDVSYIYVGRDLRDVFMSLWNHYDGHSEAFYETINNPDTLVGTPFPRCPKDIKTLWNDWTSKASFNWENDGYPHWSASHHAQTWWDYRELPNIQFVHYADLLANPGSEIKGIAQFLNIEVSDSALANIVDRVSFKSMRGNAADIMGGASAFWDGGAQRFLHKGSNGRWRDALTQEDLQAYESMVERTLSQDCAAWLEQGRAAL